jgi:hypothetical protein
VANWLWAPTAGRGVFPSSVRVRGRAQPSCAPSPRGLTSAPPPGAGRDLFPLVCPAYDAGKAQNPLPLALAGETPVGGTSGQFTVGGDGAARYSIPLRAVPGPDGR